MAGKLDGTGSFHRRRCVGRRMIIFFTEKATIKGSLCYFFTSHLALFFKTNKLPKFFSLLGSHSHHASQAHFTMGHRPIQYSKGENQLFLSGWGFEEKNIKGKTKEVIYKNRHQPLTGCIFSLPILRPLMRHSGSLPPPNRQGKAGFTSQDQLESLGICSFER